MRPGQPVGENSSLDRRDITPMADLRSQMGHPGNIVKTNTIKMLGTLQNIQNIRANGSIFHSFNGIYHFKGIRHHLDQLFNANRTMLAIASLDEQHLGPLAVYASTMELLETIMKLKEASPFELEKAGSETYLDLIINQCRPNPMVEITLVILLLRARGLWQTIILLASLMMLIGFKLEPLKIKLFLPLKILQSNFQYPFIYNQRKATMLSTGNRNSHTILDGEIRLGIF